MKRRSQFSRIPGALGITAFLAIAVVIAVPGAYHPRAIIVQTFDRQSKINQAQVWLEELSRLQIDEESSVRGYALTRDPFYKDQYAQAVKRFTARERGLREALLAENLAHATNTLDDYASLQSNWRAKIAEPQLAHPGSNIAAIDKSNKMFSDYEGGNTRQLRSDLASTSDDLGRASQEELNRSLVGRVFWLLVFGLLAILFNAFRTRSNRELEEERTITETLQRAFRSEHVPLPNADVGSAYLSASSHLAVGGDVFDVYRLSDTLALILIADVSGKGVDAAVLTAFIKFTIRGIGLRRRDPGAMLAEFNTAFAQTVENPYLFVSMFVGVLDTDTLQLRYASAGHDSAFLRRSSTVQQLAVTGPVLGVMEEPFETKAIHLENGDTIVLATDGLTEARNRSGEQLHESGAMELIERCSRAPQLMADEIVAQVRAMGGNTTRDDIAVLAIRVWEREATDAGE